ncbi:DNA dC-_dU-editing enzyme APOBEC-3C-like isoform X2 [Ranitomeya imitator]|uniref:DNA dC->dU-editing enzyme APOBEC-3C-like isoform X2 n=1 Tax=Ranitomeya imitator TaxID=111125 RepID=UPI0037E81B8D
MGLVHKYPWPYTLAPTSPTRRMRFRTTPPELLDMTLFIRKFLSEEEFHDNFNTNDLVNKALVCFSLEDKKPPWKLWGFAYNNPGVEHAEITVLQELSKFWRSNCMKKDSQYKITLYATYSPCLNCCEEICRFLNNKKEKVILNLNISRFYNFHDIDNKISLKILRKYGVQIKMMDLEDFKACFYLFVDPKEQFEPCEELNVHCERNAIELDHLWHEYAEYIGDLMTCMINSNSQYEVKFILLGNLKNIYSEEKDIAQYCLRLRIRLLIMTMTLT